MDNWFNYQIVKNSENVKLLNLSKFFTENYFLGKRNASKFSIFQTSTCMFIYNMEEIKPQLSIKAAKNVEKFCSSSESREESSYLVEDVTTFCLQSVSFCEPLGLTISTGGRGTGRRERRGEKRESEGRRAVKFSHT